MKNQTIIKIDLCKSKLFNQQKEAAIPEIRQIALAKLIEVSKTHFPYGEKPYPDGSYYKDEGDAVFFIIEKPTVAIRSSIEFMKQWYYDGLKQDFPECRVIIHRGGIETTQSPVGTSVVGKVFEDISVIEKKLDDGKIFVTEDVKKNSDVTITKFVHYVIRSDAHNKPLPIYYLAFSDPRTFNDDALVHALFIAHKEASEIRRKIFRFFLIEYLLDEDRLTDLSEFENWARKKDYSLLPREELQELLGDDSIFHSDIIDNKTAYHLRNEVKKEIIKAQEDFNISVKKDIQIISEEIIKLTKLKNAVDGFNMKKITEEYLCGIFSEIRMIANYFRNTFHLYDSDGNTYKRFDYILDRYLTDVKEDLAKQWKEAFISGLKKLSEQGSFFISAIFQNILAGYYLNRSFQASPYQQQKLQERIIFIDTNILYSLRCYASNYHIRVKYFSERLSKINVPLKLYPFTIEEFEYSLERVETMYRSDAKAPYLLAWNPWLHQEFRANPYKYMNDIGVCRNHYSITKGKSIDNNNYQIFNEELKQNNIILEPQYETYDEEKRTKVWEDLRQLILKKAGDMEDYWIMSGKLYGQSDSVIEHDVNLLENVKTRYVKEGEDELGPKVMLITTDSKLMRCKDNYPFLVTTEQFLEFMMPYLFLADIPNEDPNKFPNQILSAQLGVHSSYWRPSVQDTITGFFKNPDSIDELYTKQASQFASILNKQRLSEIINESQQLNETDKATMISGLSKSVEQDISDRNEASLTRKQMEILKQELEKERAEKDALAAKAEKLQKTLKYWKRLRRSKK